MEKCRKASTAAEVMDLTATRLKELGLIDNIVPEPLGGAHRNYHEMARNLKQCLVEELNELDTFDKRWLIRKTLRTFNVLRLLLITYKRAVNLPALFLCFEK